MQLIKKCRIHDAILWRSKGDNGRGTSVYELPVQIKCRWEGLESQQFTADSIEHRCNSLVLVDRNVKVGDILKLGLLTAEVGDTTDPTSLDDVNFVRKVEKTPTLRNADMTNFDKVACYAYLGQ
jgi:hypothetical protein